MTDQSVSESAAEDGSRVFVAGDVLYPPETEADLLAPELRERVEGAELAVANLEAPIDPRGEPMAKSGPAKAAAAETATVLGEAGFDAVSLANNHVMDYGARGLRRTLRECERAGLATVGAGSDRTTAVEPYRTEVGDSSVAVFSFCEQEFGVATDDTAGTAWASHPRARQAISEESRRSDAVVVVAHGGVEYVPFPPPQRQTRLRGFVDAGADLVVGHHPHVPQGWETYHGSAIFYSLGNFRFEQPNRPKTDWGLALDFSLDEGTISDIDLVPTELVDGTVDEIPHERAVDEHLQYLYRVTECLGSREDLVAHWQETAMHLFEQRYTNWLRRGTGARLRDQLRQPTQHTSVDAAWGEGRHEEMLVLLNVVRNESHRAVVETALELKTGDREDRRTEAVREEVRELVAWTEDRPFYDRPSPLRATLGALAGNLSRRLPTLSTDVTPWSESDGERS